MVNNYIDVIIMYKIPIIIIIIIIIRIFSSSVFKVSMRIFPKYYRCQLQNVISTKYR